MHDAAKLNELSKVTMNKGSKSFSLAAKFFSQEEFESASRIYYWCRYCDDVIDNQRAQKKDLEELRYQTFVYSQEPQFVAFREIREKYQIPDLYPSELLQGMKMDIENYQYHTLEDLKLYCYRVASTVGLMMCHVMGIYNESALPQAAQLGMAMQLTNIARDVKEDFERGRIYLPLEWLQIHNIPMQQMLDHSHRKSLFAVVKRLLLEAEELYASSRAGLQALPLRSAFAVTMALNIYREIGLRIMQMGPDALNSRVVISHPRKLLLVMKSAWQIMITLPARMFNKQPVISIQNTWSPS